MSQIEPDSSDLPSSALSGTTERQRTRSVYQRKVRVSMTRAQAALAEVVFRKVAADPAVREIIGLSPTKTIQTRASRLWDMTSRAIARRDQAMRFKSYGTHSDPLVEDTDRDLPLEGFGEDSQ